MRLFVTGLLLGFSMGVWLASCAQPAVADDRRYLRGDPGYDGLPPALLAQQVDLIHSGVWLWEYQQDPGVPSLHAPVQAALDEYGFEFGILPIEAAGGNVQFARSSSTFYFGDGFTPGCPGAVACLPKYAASMEIWYDAPIMATYFFRSQVQVALHEGGHAIADAGEMYIHTGGRIQCNANPQTVMSCGIGTALSLQDFDRVTVSRYLFPQSFTGGVLAGGLVWYGSSDPRTTRLAVYYRTYTSYTFWTGQTIQTVCATPGVCGAFALSLPLGPCTDVLLGSENGLPGSWGRGLQRVGGTACE